MGKQRFLDEAKKIFPNYDYSKVEYVNSKTPVTIICPIHGEFKIKPEMLTYYGSSCPECDKKLKGSKRIDNEEFIRRAKKVFPDYDYSKTVYKSMKDKVTVICNVCEREFYPLPQNLLRGHGCDVCGREKSIIARQDTTETFIQKARKVWGDLYDYSKTVFTGPENEVIITCPIHGDFKKIARNHINSHQGCTYCSLSKQSSKAEKEISEYLKSQIPNIEIIENSREILQNTQELDIYLPQYKLGIEFDGIYWHSELNKPDNYHIRKTEECEKQGIQLIHIFENEWLNKQDIVKSRLRQLLGITKYKIPARKCTVKVISSDTEKQFMNNNHLQGYVSSTVCYGLYYEMNNKEYLVACMSFGNLRKNLGANTQSGTFELYRFCCLKNFTIIGGASKLFKHFINVYKPNKVISFANRRYSTNIHDNLYVKLGFKFDSFTSSSYFYIVDNELVNRFNLRKDILISKYGCPKEKSEHQFCMEQGWYRIYDCGNLKYVWNKNN